MCQYIFCVFASASAGSFTLVEINLFKYKINTSLNSFFSKEIVFLCGAWRLNTQIWEKVEYNITQNCICKSMEQKHLAHWYVIKQILRMNCIIFTLLYVVGALTTWRYFLQHKGNWSDLVYLPQTQRLAGVTPHPPPHSAQGERWQRPCPWVPRRPVAGVLWWASCAWLTVAWWRYLCTLLVNEDC